MKNKMSIKFIASVFLFGVIMIFNFTGTVHAASDDIVYRPNGDITAVVTASDVCFRRHASTSSEIIYILQEGDRGKWLGGTAGNEWGKVLYNGVIGFIYSQYLKYE